MCLSNALLLSSKVLEDHAERLKQARSCAEDVPVSALAETVARKMGDLIN